MPTAPVHPSGSPSAPVIVTPGEGAGSSAGAGGPGGGGQGGGGLASTGVRVGGLAAAALALVLAGWGAIRAAKRRRESVGGAA